jgi:hypothetical protein
MDLSVKELAVPTAPLATIEEILGRLRTKHFARNDLALAPVCTRVMLRTGTNLRSPKPEQDRDPAAIAKVMACLAEMGYPL